MKTHSGIESLSKACDEFVIACFRNGVSVSADLLAFCHDLAARARLDSGQDVLIEIRDSGKAA